MQANFLQSEKNQLDVRIIGPLEGLYRISLHCDISVLTGAVNRLTGLHVRQCAASAYFTQISIII